MNSHLYIDIYFYFRKFQMYLLGEMAYYKSMSGNKKTHRRVCWRDCIWFRMLAYSSDRGCYRLSCGAKGGSGLMLYWFSAWPHCLILVTFLVLRRLEEESSIDLGRDRIASLAAVVGILSFDARGLGASGLMLYWFSGIPHCFARCGGGSS